MPTPPTIRYATNSANVAETAQPNADTVNSTADSIIERFLPMLSPSIPATDTPKMLPTRAQPTYQPFWSASKENWPATVSIVPDMTAVS